MANYDVVVIGCGITGASTAYHLARRGAGRILLLDRAGPAAGGTGKSAALVRQHYSTPLLTRLAYAGVDMFARMAEELGQDGGYCRVGWAFLVTPNSLEAVRRNMVMQCQVGVKTRELQDDEIAVRLPELNRDGVAAVIWEEEGGFADPVRSTENYVAAFACIGGEVRCNTPCRALLREGDHVIGVLLDEGLVGAGAVVNAAGPWASRLAKSAGIELDMRALREQDTVWQVAAGRPLPMCAISNAVDAIYLRPLGEGRYLLGRGFPKPYEECDPENYKQTADQYFVDEVIARAQRRFPPFQGAKLITAYTALYDVTADWYPFVGPRADLSGYYDACGGSGHGFKLAPAIGRELADWIVDGSCAEDFAALSYDRIGQNRMFQQSYGGNRG
jgi:glycine/D-amino acid oxidase-like deaminating enzyme